MSGTYFGEISVGRGSAIERLDPHSVVIAGLDLKETARIAKIGPEEAALIAEVTMPASNRELEAFLKDPNEFLASWPVESTAVYMRGLLEGILQLGRFVKPATVRAIPSAGAFVVNDGRHNFVAARVLWDCLAGKRKVEAVDALVREKRKAFGRAWRPDCPALPPAKDSVSGTYASAAFIADVSQQVRIPTLPELYERAMMQVRAARSSDETPDWKALGLSYGQESAVIENWERLSTMDPFVRDAVLLGTGPKKEGPRFPLSAALAFIGKNKATGKPWTHAEQRAAVEALLAAGDTRVATARATAKGATPANDTTPAPRTSKDGATSREPAASGAGGASVKVRRPPWTVADLTKFVEAHKGEIPPGIVAVQRLLKHGPEALDATLRAAVPGLDAYLQS